MFKSIARLAFCLFAVAMCCFSQVLLAAEKATALETLQELAESNYNYEDVGLNRFTCYVKSPEILADLDSTARKAVGKAKYQAIYIPGQTIQVKAQEMPSRADMGVRMGLNRFGSLMGKWLNEIFVHQINIPKLIDPERGLKGYSVEWIEGHEGRRIQLKQVSKQVQQLNKKGGLDGQGGKGFKGAEPREAKRKRGMNFKPRGFKEKIKNRIAKANKDDKVKGALAGDMQDGVDLDLSGGEFEIHLNYRGELEYLIHRKEDGLDKTRIKTKKVGKKWLLQDLDHAKFDAQDRLIERNLIRYTFSYKSGVYVPKKLTLKLLDSKGKLIKRQDDPNPITIDFSSHQVEVRK
jgi:hypothetical protein